jgi:hypothetical protein
MIALEVKKKPCKITKVQRVKKLKEFKKEPEVPILDIENRVTICPSETMNNFFLYHTIELCSSIFLMQFSCTLPTTRSCNANDDEPFKEGPNLRRNWSVGYVCV